MLTYDLDKRGNTPLYDYIYKCIRDDIKSGQLVKDEKLPSKRLLAENLSVSIITVQNAYEQLMFEGYIYAKEKKGYYVADIDTESSVKTVDRAPNKSVRDHKISQNASITTDFTTNSNKRVRQIFPFATWAKLMRRNLLDEQGRLESRAASDSIGEYELREAIKNHLIEYRGLNVSADNIIVGAGMEYLYGLLVQILGRSKMIAVEDPGHTKVSRIYESNGIKVVHIPVDKDGIVLNRLENESVCAVHVTPAHHFPTGAVYTAARRHALITLARKKGQYIIEDDYDSEFRFTGKPLPTLASLDPDNVIYMNTFSKSLMGIVRIAYMVLPDSLMEEYNKKLGFYSCTVPVLEQYTLASFIKEGYYERHINRTRLYYKKCRKEFIEAFAESKLSSVATVEENSAGLHFIIRLSGKKIKDDSLKKKLLKKGIRIACVSDYCYREAEEYNNRIIINYFEENKENIIKAFDSIKESL